MKTRNNQSHADETLLNQSITRRNFVKRSALASAATVFGVVGITSTAFAAPVHVFLGVTYSVDNPGSHAIEGVVANMDALMDLVASRAATSTPAIPRTYNPDAPDFQTLIPIDPIVTAASGGFTYHLNPDGTIYWRIDGPVSITIQYQDVGDYFANTDPLREIHEPLDPTGPGSPPADPGPPTEPPLF